MHITRLTARRYTLYLCAGFFTLARTFIYFSLFICSVTQANETVLQVNDASDLKSGYIISMAELALQHVDKKYRIARGGELLTQSRIQEDVNGGNLDFMWSSTNATIESDMLPVRIPLYKGLIGHRLLIIRQGDQARFDNVHTLADLQAFTMGQGKRWADTKILQANGINVITSSKYPNLFYMLDGGRFDAFPRGVNEPFVEVAKYPQLKLAIEKNIMLVYRMPFYIFVRKDNVALAKDFETGFNRAIADGSFEKLFLSNPTVQDVIEKADLNHRRIINIDNPTLSKETPLDRPELWVDPRTLGKN